MINLVGFLQQNIQKDLQIAKSKDEENITILTEQAEELISEDCTHIGTRTHFSSLLSVKGD